MFRRQIEVDSFLNVAPSRLAKTALCFLQDGISDARHWVECIPATTDDDSPRCCFAVALNFQTPGEQMDLNQGRFLANGRCGYILKPAFLCSPKSTFNPENTGGGPGHIPTQLTIRVSLRKVLCMELDCLRCENSKAIPKKKTTLNCWPLMYKKTLYIHKKIYAWIKKKQHYT